MTKFLNLTIKIDNKDKYKKSNSFPYFGWFLTIAPNCLEIKDQHGGIISELIAKGGLGKFPVGDIKRIKLPFSVLSIPISWAWENKSADTEIEFTLKIKFDEMEGLNIGSIPPTFGGVIDTLSLYKEDFEVEIFETERRKKYHFGQIIELSDKYPDIKKTFNDFRDLNWKIIKAREEEQIVCFVSEVEEWQNATHPSLKQKFYHLKNIDDNSEEVKGICQDFLKEVQDLAEWKKVGIKTLTDAEIAKLNGFDIISTPSLKNEISREGKYRGFPIASVEKHKMVIRATGFGSGNQIIIKNRYTKNNIDVFRDFFTNYPDQSDPKYFRGFRPGDIERLFDGKFVSVNHYVDIRDKSNNQYEIKENEDFTRIYYEIETHQKQGPPNFNELLELILQTSDLIIGKTRKEVLDIKFKQWWEYWDKSRHSQAFYQNLTDLFLVLDNDFARESKEKCETAFNTLKNYENLPDKEWIKKRIKDKYSSEIEAKKNEIVDRMKVLFQEEIDAVMNEDYGSGSLSPERKKIFTTYRNQIGTSPLLTEIKGLIKSLVKAEKFIAEFKNLDKMVSLKKLKEEYQNGNGDKKTSYNIVNQVDNQWVERIIAELGIIEKKDSQIFLEETRTQLKDKYANDELAQAIFDNEILDSIEALQEAEKLLIKVREARTKNDMDASLLTLLQGYQEAETGVLKNKAWQAVNIYNMQVEAAIKHLQEVGKNWEELVKIIHDAKNESKLEQYYNQIKDNELYKQSSKTKRVIRNLVKRKKISFQLDQENISPENKIFLQTALVKLIPETIKEDKDEQELTELENQLKTFKTALENEEKGQIYQKYKKTINQVLTEISQEKERYQQTKLHVNDNQQKLPKENNQNFGSGFPLPDWAWGLIIIVAITVIGTIFLYSILYFYRRRWQVKFRSDKKHKE